MYGEEQMRAEMAMKEAQMRRSQDAIGQATIGGSIGYGAENSRPCLRERLHMQLVRAERESSKKDVTTELLMLLEKHPDVARIIELVEALG